MGDVAPRLALQGVLQAVAGLPGQDLPAAPVGLPVGRGQHLDRTVELVRRVLGVRPRGPPHTGVVRHREVVAQLVAVLGDDGRVGEVAVAELGQPAEGTVRVPQQDASAHHRVVEARVRRQVVDDLPSGDGVVGNDAAGDRVVVEVERRHVSEDVRIVAGEAVDDDLACPLDDGGEADLLAVLFAVGVVEALAEDAAVDVLHDVLRLDGSDHRRRASDVHARQPGGGAFAAGGSLPRLRSQRCGGRALPLPRADTGEVTQWPKS